MNLTKEQSYALSQLAYISLPAAAEGKTLGYLFDVLDPTSALISDRSMYGALTSWTIVNIQDNTQSGFAGIALQAPDDGPVVFAFRGTEGNLESESFATVLQDLNADVQLATDSSSTSPNQFSDAYSFVKVTLSDISGSNLSDSQVSDYIETNDTEFTGHSLGGGIVQYIIHKFDAGQAITFNAVGMGQVLC
jgi:hypothetical protein